MTDADVTVTVTRDAYGKYTAWQIRELATVRRATKAGRTGWVIEGTDSATLEPHVFAQKRDALRALRNWAGAK